MQGFFDATSDEMKLTEQESLTPKCGICQYFKSCKNPKLQYQGQGQEKILIVSEFPNTEADQNKKHFDIEMEFILKTELKRNGINLYRDCWVTSALICRPTHKHKKKDATEYCRPNLIKLIKELKPNVIILLGEYAIEFIRYIKRDSFSEHDKFVGWQIPSQVVNAWVCPINHPNYLKREGHPVLQLNFSEHIRKAVAKRKSKPWKTIPDYKKEITPVWSTIDFMKFMKKILKEKPLIAFDYETNAMKPEKEDSKITHISISDGKQTLSSKWNTKFVELFKAIMIDPKIKKIASNMKFEHRWTKTKLKCDVRGWDHDTMVAAHVLDNRGGIASIKFQAFVLLGQPIWSKVVEPYLHSRNKGGYELNRIDECPEKDLLIYCGLDSLLEYKVAQIQKQNIENR